MKMSVSAMLLLSSLGLMGACSDSANSGGPPAPMTPSYDDLNAQGEALSQDLEGRDPTNFGVLPTAGSATYNGVMGVSGETGTGETFDLLGDVTLVADFSNGPNQVTGSATDFVNSANASYDGTLDIRDGRINRDVNREFLDPISASIGGTLTSPSGTDLSISGDLSADIYGDGYQNIAGTVEGQVFTENSVGFWGGNFVTER